MDIGSLLTLLSILVLSGFLIARPLLEKKAAGVSEDELVFSSLMAERDRILEALEELEFDFKLGKIPEQEYPLRQKMLYQQGAEILQKIDRFESQTLSPARAQEALTEAAARSALQPPPGPAQRRPVTEDDEIETLLAARRRSRRETAGGFCPQCGQAYQRSDKFCSKCGTVLN